MGGGKGGSIFMARHVEGGVKGAIFCFEPLRKYDVSSNAQHAYRLSPSLPPPPSTLAYIFS